MNRHLSIIDLPTGIKSRLMEIGEYVVLAIAILALQACAGVNTFPMIARAGDTVSVMVGGSEMARKETIQVTLKNNGTGQTWDLQGLGLVRSVFNVRSDGLAQGLHYSSYLESDVSWILGHEPVQTMLIVDLPSDAAPGASKLIISNVGGDNSSGIAEPVRVNLEVIPGAGSSDQFMNQSYLGNPFPASFDKLEPAPHAKISFGGVGVIGAVALKISFNSSVLNGDDINIYAPEATVRAGGGAFGETQRMMYWRQDGQNLYVDIVAPQGISGKYLQVYVIHPRGLPSLPDFTLVESKLYGVDGNAISGAPVLQYSP